MTTFLAIAALILLGIILGWHWLFAGAVAITATVWAIVIASVVLFCAGILLLFILAGISVFLICIIGVMWAILAVILFPVVFPILAPLLIILFFISFIRWRNQKK